MCVLRARARVCVVRVFVRLCFVMCGCFDNCVVVLVICVLAFTVLCIVCAVSVVFRLCIFYFSFVCTSIRTTATG